MTTLKALVSGVAFMAMSAQAATDFGGSDEMGPAAFMWPSDRVWSAAMDNTAPCGSVAGAGNRSDFPRSNGKIALVGQDDSYDIELSISYLTDPKSNSDFTTLIDADHFKEIDPGHTCVDVADAPSSVSAGDKATLQIKYIADFDSPENQTFYACADITYVELSDFKESIPCFNATNPEGEDGDSDHGSDSDASTSATAVPEEGGSGGGGLSGGAIAGIVIGSIGGVAIVALAAFMVYRRGAKAQRARALKQQAAARGVNWGEQPPKDSQSGASIRMNNM